MTILLGLGSLQNYSTRKTAAEIQLTCIDVFDILFDDKHHNVVGENDFELFGKLCHECIFLSEHICGRANGSLVLRCCFKLCH